MESHQTRRIQIDFCNLKKKAGKTKIKLYFNILNHLHS